MYSEKLKKLIEAKTPLKFRVTSQQSKELQEFLFALDIEWQSGNKNILCCYSKFIFLEEGGWNKAYCITQEIDNYEYFKNHKAKAFDLEHDCLVEDLPKKPWYEKLELGKKYKLKDGREVVFICRKTIPSPFSLCFVEVKSGESLCTYRLSGQWLMHGKSDADIDLSQFDEKQPLDLTKILKVGEVYKAKNGKNLFLVHKTDYENSLPFQFVYVTGNEDNSDWHLDDWDAKGASSMLVESEWDLDLTQFEAKN